MLPFQRLSLRSDPLWQFCEIGWQWNPPPLSDSVLWFVQSGRGELKLDSETFGLSSNMGFILQPNTRPVAWHDPLYPLRIFSCHFTLRGWNGESLWNNGSVVRSSTSFIFSAQKTQSLWTRGDKDGRELARRGIEQLVLGLWDESRHPSPSEREGELDELVEAIRREPGRAWNLDDMAFAVNLSRAHFVRCFRARFDCAPMALVTQIRLKRAQQLLRESQLSLETIARAVGYGEAPFLSKNFKTAFGMTPGEWRQREKNFKKNFDSVIDNSN